MSSACSTSQHHTKQHSCYMPLPRDDRSTKASSASDSWLGVQLGKACWPSAYSTLAPTSSDILVAYSCKMARGVFLEVAGLVRKPSIISFVRGRWVSMNLSESITCRAGRAALSCTPPGKEVLGVAATCGGHFHPATESTAAGQLPQQRRQAALCCCRTAERLQVESS